MFLLAFNINIIDRLIDDNVSDDIKGNLKKRQTSFIYEDHYVEKICLSSKWPLFSKNTIFHYKLPLLLKLLFFTENCSHSLKMAASYKDPFIITN